MTDWIRTTTMLVMLFSASLVVATDPLPGNPPSASDPARASPPTSAEPVSADPAPAEPPSADMTGIGDPLPALPPGAEVSLATEVDPAPASPPASSLALANPISSDDSIVLLIDMPSARDSSPMPSTPVVRTPSKELPPSGDALPSVELLIIEAEGVPAIPSGKPFLGVGFRNPNRPVVTTLYGSSTATKLGIVLGDEIVSLNGIAVTGIESLRAVLAAMPIGTDVSVVVRRGGTEYSLGPIPVAGRS